MIRGPAATRHPSRYRLPALLLLAAIVPALCLAQPIYTIYGEDLPLAGTAPGLTVVYLFLTGPNLPDPGISLVGGNNVATGVPGSFTRVEVQADGSWSFTWQTRSVGRTLDPGTYTLYIEQEPLARPDLDDTVFATQAIVLGAPVETVTVTATEATGTLVVDSSPSLSLVTLDGRGAGVTPLSLTGIPPGMHTLVISRDGYADYQANVTISAGESREINAQLEPLTPAPSETATAVPTTIREGGPLPLAALAAAVLGVLVFRRRW